MKVVLVAGAYDYGAILGLIQQEFSGMEGRIDPPSSIHSLRVVDIENHADVFVIEDKGTPIACMLGEAKGGVYYLGRVAVSSAYRGKGLARKLIDTAAIHAGAGLAKCLEVKVRIELTENHAAFAKLGFIKTHEGRHDGFVCATYIIMQRPL